jgi:hypothetical protein
VRRAGPGNCRDGPSTIWDVAARTYPWLFAALAILLVSCIPGVGGAVEPLRILGVALCAFGIFRLVTGYRAIRRVGHTERKLERAAAKSPLLPYDSGPYAWIGRGFSYDDEVDRRGSVRVSGGEFVIVKSDGEQLAAAPVQTVRLQRVPVWLGLGVRIRLGEMGDWYVQPHYEPTSPVTGWRATRRLKAACVVAQRIAA